MYMVPNDPVSRDFAIDCFLEDWRSGRVEAVDADQLRAQLRTIGDLAWLEKVARALATPS